MPEVETLSMRTVEIAQFSVQACPYFGANIN
jgi:hypothetical protein